MTPTRAGVALLLVGMVCLTVVALRAEKVRVESRIQAHTTELIHCRRRVWSLQMEIARLRTPERIQQRIERFSLTVGADFGRLLTPRADNEAFASLDD
ncbi:MAG: hypothetical protein GXP29_14725 [Planctomycetes bacterium]|nr:hypothetical protein [Planctomycetota bacterium]